MKSKCRMFGVLFYMVVMTKLRSTTFGIPIPTMQFSLPEKLGSGLRLSAHIIIPLNPFICRKLPPEASFSAHTLAAYTNHSVPLRSHAPSERAMLRRARVPMPAAARPQGGPLPKAKGAPAPGALRVLYRAAVDAVLYAFLAVGEQLRQHRPGDPRALGLRGGLLRGGRRPRRPRVFHVRHGVALPVLHPAGRDARPRVCRARPQGAGKGEEGEGREGEGIDTTTS